MKKAKVIIVSFSFLLIMTIILIILIKHKTLKEYYFEIVNKIKIWQEKKEANKEIKPDMNMEEFFSKYRVAKNIKIINRKEFPEINTKEFASFLGYSINLRNDNLPFAPDFMTIMENNSNKYKQIEDKFKIKLPSVDFQKQEVVIAYGKKIDKLIYFVGDYNAGDRFCYIFFSSDNIEGIEMLIVNSEKNSWWVLGEDIDRKVFNNQHKDYYFNKLR